MGSSSPHQKAQKGLRLWRELPKWDSRWLNETRCVDESIRQYNGKGSCPAVKRSFRGDRIKPVVFSMLYYIKDLAGIDRESSRIPA
jgi:hypothetical protein